MQEPELYISLDTQNGKIESEEEEKMGTCGILIWRCEDYLKPANDVLLQSRQRGLQSDFLKIYFKNFITH